MTGQLLHPRAIQGDDSNDGYVLTTIGGVPAWMPGAGLPVGGTAGQILTKQSGTDYDADWASPGGGGGTAGHDRRWNIGAGESSIDEFNDSTLGGAWTRVDAAGGTGRATWTEGADVLSVTTAGGDTGQEIHGIVVALSSFGGSIATGDGFVTALTQVQTSNWFIGGIVIADGATYGAGNQLLGAVLSDLSISTRTYTNYNTQGTSVAQLQARGAFVYIRTSYLGSNNWRTDVSADGVSWFKPASTASKTMTATHVGLFATSFGTSTKGQAGFEFLRRVSGVT